MLARSRTEVNPLGYVKVAGVARENEYETENESVALDRFDVGNRHRPLPLLADAQTLRLCAGLGRRPGHRFSSRSQAAAGAPQAARTERRALLPARDYHHRSSFEPDGVRARPRTVRLRAESTGERLIPARPEFAGYG